MAVESRVTQEEIKKEPEKPIDREKVRVAGGCGAGAGGRSGGCPGAACGRVGGKAKCAPEADSLPLPRPARCCCGSSPLTTAATTEWTSSPAGTCLRASCRSTPGELRGAGALWAAPSGTDSGDDTLGWSELTGVALTIWPPGTK